MTHEEWEQLPEWPFADMGGTTFARHLSEFVGLEPFIKSFDLFRAREHVRRSPPLGAGKPVFSGEPVIVLVSRRTPATAAEKRE